MLSFARFKSGALRRIRRATVCSPGRVSKAQPEPSGQMRLWPFVPQHAEGINLPVAALGLRRGDVIQEAGRKPVETVADLREAVGAAGDEPLLLLVNRGGRTTYVALESR